MKIDKEAVLYVIAMVVMVVAFFGDLFLASGCGHTDKPETQDHEARWDRTCDTVECPGASDTKTAIDEGIKYKSCTWVSACFKGACRKRVKVFFQSSEETGHCWQKTGHQYEPGSCPSEGKKTCSGSPQ